MGEIVWDVASARNKRFGIRKPVLALVDILCALWGG